MYRLPLTSPDRPTFFTDSTEFVYDQERGDQKEEKSKKPVNLKKRQHLPVRAAGIVPYIFFPTPDGEKIELKFLVVLSNGKYEILGGKTEVGDKSINHTAQRELWEETNYLLEDWLRSLPEDISPTQYYFPTSKFLMFFVHMPSEFVQPSSAFGDVEKLMGKKRKIVWATIEDIARGKMVKYDQKDFVNMLKLIQETVNNIYSLLHQPPPSPGERKESTF